MPIHNIIHEKRKEIGLTQEQIANYLGVSTPAVNKWEKGTTYPDISLLPSLARLLETDVNTLLGFNEGLSDNEIAHFSIDITKEIENNGFDAGFTMAAGKIREYPNCAPLLHSLAVLMDGSLLMSELTADEKENYQNQIITWYQRAANGNDEKTKNASIFMLAGKYIQMEEYEKAQKLVDTLPVRSAMDKRNLQANIFLGQNKMNEAAELMEHQLLQTANEAYGILLKLTDIEAAAGNTQRASQIAEIASQSVRLFHLWDYNSFVAPLQAALAKKDVEESISLLKALLSSVSTPWNTEHSPLYCRISTVSTAASDSYKKLLPLLLVALENSPEYDFLRSSPEFQELLEYYRFSDKR